MHDERERFLIRYAAGFSAAIRPSLDEIVHLNSWTLSEPVEILDASTGAVLSADASLVSG